MYILAIDTSTNAGGVALSRNNEVIGVVMLKTPLRYSEKILYYVDFLLHQHELEIASVDCFAVTTGPGSFTGLRVGLATTKAFCQALNRPAVGISTLEALAYRFRWVHSRIAPMIDARRQQIYGAVFEVANSEIRLRHPSQVAPAAAWLKTIPMKELLFVGDGAQLYKRAIFALEPEARVLETDNSLLEALCRLSYRRFIQGQKVTAEQLRANYVRPADAELAKTR